jgi:predicted secreted Zn-dependent protease
LQRHEQNHVQSARLAAEALRKRIEALGPEAECATLEQRIKQVSDGAIAEFRKRDEDYDRETDHGRMEGARL